MNEIDWPEVIQTQFERFRKKQLDLGSSPKDLRQELDIYTMLKYEKARREENKFIKDLHEKFEAVSTQVEELKEIKNA